MPTTEKYLFKLSNGNPNCWAAFDEELSVVFGPEYSPNKVSKEFWEFLSERIKFFYDSQHVTVSREDLYKAIDSIENGCPTRAVNRLTRLVELYSEE